MRAGLGRGVRRTGGAVTYYVFAGDHYYPSGGAEDLVCSIADKEQAIAKAEDAGSGTYRWSHVWNPSEGIVWDSWKARR